MSSVFSSRGCLDSHDARCSENTSKTALLSTLNHGPDSSLNAYALGANRDTQPDDYGRSQDRIQTETRYIEKALLWRISSRRTRLFDRNEPLSVVRVRHQLNIQMTHPHVSWDILDTIVCFVDQ